MTTVNNSGVHKPKQETFDVSALTNIDPKGFTRQVDEYRESSIGLYMARAADHPHFHYVESWLLPSLGIRVTDFHFTPGNERPQDFYIDIAQISRNPNQPVWTTVDLYLDIICRADDRTEVLDVDELIAATMSGLISAAASEAAIDTAFRAATGIAAHGHKLPEWLSSEGLSLTWRRR